MTARSQIISPPSPRPSPPGEGEREDALRGIDNVRFNRRFQTAEIFQYA